MESEWQEKRISEIANFENHRRVPLKSLDREKRQGVYPYYGASGIVDYINNYIFDGKFLLISEDGENLKSRKTPIAFKAQGKFWVNNHAHILSEKEPGGLEFLEYYFSNLDINPYLTGAVQPKLNKKTLDSIPIRFPNQEIRKKINLILGSLDKKIQLNNKINQTLEAIAQALFKSWFVDFDPVKAKAEVLANGGSADDANRAAMRTISGKTDAELEVMATNHPEGHAQLAHTASLFPDKLVDSELGNIPEGFNTTQLSKMIQLTGGGTPKRSEPEYWDGKILWFSVKDAPANSDIFVIETKEKITQLGLSKSSTKLLPKGTTIITARGTVGKLALTATEMCMNQSCYGINGIDFGAIFTYFNIREAVDNLKQQAHGAVFDTITTKTFNSYIACKPLNNIADDFELRTNPLMEKIESNLRQNQTLATLRDTLLPKLLSGELKVNALADDMEALHGS